MPRCYVLDVGHGNAALLVGDEKVAVVDAGPKAYLGDFLTELGINRIDAVLVSHADADHIGGLMALIAKIRSEENFTVGYFYLNPDPRPTELWADLVKALEELDESGESKFVPDIGWQSPENFDLGGCAIEVLGPGKGLRAHAVGGKGIDAGRKSTANTLSAVVRVVIDGKGWLLLPGDIDLVGYDDLARLGREISAACVVFPHHGGKGGTDEHTRELAERLVNDTSVSTLIFSTRSDDGRFPSRIVVEQVLSTSPKPVVVSIGHSPVLAELLEGYASGIHLNGHGTILIDPPLDDGGVRIKKFADR